ncbi:MAG: FtsX-like permease family protein, partial [Vicinamibacterales bacterium]
LWLGGLAALFVLLAGCANAANLMIARATLRRDEIAIRFALGAHPMRLARQLLVESAVLASFGATLGVGTSAVFLRAFVLLAGGAIPRVDHLQLNAAALGVAIGVALGAALLFGGAAAWLLVSRASGAVARSDGLRATRSNRLGGVLLVSQVAFATMLIAGALLVVRSYATVLRINPGFDTTDTLTLQLTLPPNGYPDTPAHLRFADRMLAEVAAIPGIVSVGVVSDLPFVGNTLGFAVTADTAPAQGATRMTVRLADAGFFRTLRIPLHSGRTFDADDRTSAPPVAVLNQTAADRLAAPDVGRRVMIAGEPPRTIVGVVGDIKHLGLRADEGPVVYVPYAQKTFAFVNWMGIVARGRNVERSASSVKDAIARVDPNQPVYAVRAMADYVDRETAPFEFGSLIVGSLAAAAVVLAVSGIYGLTTFIVGRRTHEIGIRLALGATKGNVVWLVLRQIAMTMAIGSGIGVGCAVLTNGLLKTALTDTTSAGRDAMILLGGCALLAAAALLTAAGPALRATRIDPRAALQCE